MKKVTFTLPAEALGDATEAILLGDFNNWDPAKAVTPSVQKDGTLKTVVLLEPGKTYEYRYLLNNGSWINDWAAQGYAYKPALRIENSVITVAEEGVIVEESVVVVTEKPVAKAVNSVSKKTKAVAPKKAAAKKTTPSKPAAKTKAASSKDDLTKIEGIGPKIAKLLEADGISDFNGLSKATGKKLKTILDAAGPKFQIHNPASWPKQAKLAAAGKWEDLQKLQSELKAGK